ncbi:MAG: ASCH domain-containing protein [Acidobacteria bacterium]|nr:ASCH domain-containing protein [Acidobacteriota bacterium]
MSNLKTFWERFVTENPAYAGRDVPVADYFCDNKKDADECADLVVEGIKRATTSSVWAIEKFDEKMPAVGDLSIVTDWEGEPKAVIEVTKVEVVKFKDVTAEYAFIEGEGDKSLQYWRDVHWEFYKREMQPHGEHPTEDMQVVCEYFTRIGQ